MTALYTYYTYITLFAVTYWHYTVVSYSQSVSQSYTYKTILSVIQWLYYICYNVKWKTTRRVPINHKESVLVKYRPVNNLNAGIYKVPYPHPMGGGTLLSILGKKIKFWRWEGNIKAVGKKKRKKKEKGEAMSSFYNIKAVGKNI